MCRDIVIITSKWYKFRQYLWLYVNFKNGFAFWENFENRHPEKVTKISKICKEDICGGVLLQSNHFLRFTITLFLCNLDEKITSNEQKVTSNKQKVTGNKQKVMSNEHKVMSNEQKVQPRSLANDKRSM